MKRKTIIAILIFAAAAVLLVFLAINPFFSKIKRESESVIVQKQEILESEARIQNIKDFNDNFKRYQSDLEKIDGLFVNILEPVDFIRFLEEEASLAQLTVDVNPPLLKEKEKNPWQSFDFELVLEGSFSGIARFIERLETGPYLVRPLIVSIREDAVKKEVIVGSMTIKVYAK